MIDPKVAVISHCSATGTIVAAFANRVTPDTIPSGQAYPHARIRQIGQSQGYHTTGESQRGHLLQIDVYDDDIAGANANAEIIRAAFSGYMGMMGNMLTGRVKARIVQSNWNETARNFWRIVEVEIPTND